VLGKADPNTEHRRPNTEHPRWLCTGTMAPAGFTT
jgi:hypothetical protein